ncbi:50S ribosomal protein L11 methyltransferase [Parapedobacter tibetensis]|uniref:50S ribosomal protein L11 methyltransferase n=1 Tax=Parapedobacter tibetensis TaxID=2972951 RepID=UPI00214DDFE1|nr:50S ribosomal protein L11 methyltransferase [Parapedobacter tibetensis]
MKYSEVIFTCEGGEDWHRDLLIHDLANMGFDTFEHRDKEFAAYIASEQLDLHSLESLLIHQPVDFGVTYVVNEILPQNWNEVWESNFEPVVVADQCYIRATFHAPEPSYPYEIIIDPKMAFGTGHHQTTSLMIHYMLETTFFGKSILDMGCGTGILAILAAKLGASSVLAIDNDPVSVASVEENKALNGVEHILTQCGSIDLVANQQFDIILANINRNILLNQLGTYSQTLKIGGILYMSGFYDGDDLKTLITACAKHELDYDGHKEMDGWVAGRFIKKE